MISSLAGIEACIWHWSSSMLIELLHSRHHHVPAPIELAGMLACEASHAVQNP